MKWSVLFILYFIITCSAFSADKTSLKNRLYLFSGQYTTNSMGGTANPLGADYEDFYLVAAAYSRDSFQVGQGVSAGPELGLANRFGNGRSSTEIWGGILFRHKGLIVLKGLKISPGLTAGFSLIDKTMGTEKRREEDGSDENADFLFYLGPELGISFTRNSRWEIVYRLHHRSGGDGTLGNFREAYNANTLGVRYRF